MSRKPSDGANAGHHHRAEALRRVVVDGPGIQRKFLERGGRVGTHSSNENLTPIYYNRVLCVAHFNAGVRAIDVRDPLQPREIAYYIPAITDKTDKRCV